MMTEELQKLGVIVKARAKLGVKGEYHATEVTADEPKDLPAERRPKLLAIKILEGPDAKFGMEVLIEGKPREPKEDDGLAFVKISRGETYAVRLINNTHQEMAVKLLIDGLSFYTFSELRIQDGPRKGQPQFSLVIVAPKSSVTIRGWHRTHEESNAFQVTEYAKSAAAALNHTAKLGTITAVFAASWPKGQDAPLDEPGKEKGPGAGDATGFGQRLQEKFRPVERNVGAIRAVVTARYTK